MASILVIAEHDGGQLKLATLSAIAFARKTCAAAGGSFEILVMGEKVEGIAERLRRYGASAVLVADQAQFKHPLSDRYALVIAEVVKQRAVALLVAAASTFSKDILPRAAGLLDAGMVSDVIELRLEGEEMVFKRVL